jgi:hypothetical protein
MLDHENSQQQSRPNPANERWLAMRSAYQEYMRASEALECSAQLADDSRAPGQWELAVLAGQQRVAFEQYLEARMQFLEYRFDEGLPQEADAPIQPARDAEPVSIRSLFTNFPLVLQLLTVGILGISLFALIREHQHVRSLEASRDQLAATLGDTRRSLNLLAKKVGDWQPPAPTGIPEMQHVSQPTAPAVLTPGPKPSSKIGWRRLPGKAGQQEESSHTQPPAYRRFSLARSRQFKRIGPIEVSLTSVDSKRNSVSLSIVSDSGNLHFEHIKPNQPVWINTGNRRKRVELIVDRIDKDGLDGRLIELAG